MGGKAATGILLVEDDDVYACLVGRTLERAAPGEFTIVRAARLADGLQAIDREGTHIVLLDLTLPDSQGLETWRAVLARAGHRPVVILSGADDERLAVAAVEAGAQDYLIKGLTTPELLARALRHALGRKRLEVELAVQNARLAMLASTDALTGLSNARSLHEALLRVGSREGRGDEPVSAVVLDLDHFKAYNDSFGHPAGDEVLRRVGAVLRAEARPYDVAARYGGEEFVVLLPDADAGAARAFAERLRAAIASHPWPLRPVTVSLGVATTRGGRMGGHELLSEADRALYLAKRGGRDRVVHCDDVSAPVPAAHPPAEGRAAPVTAQEVRGRVLHVDDDPDFRRAIGRLLKGAGLSVTGASTAAEGLRRAAEGPDLILLDVRLPDLDGLEACRRLKADPATEATPVLCLSSTLEHGTGRARALAFGADAALAKSAGPEELLAVVDALTRGRRPQAGRRPRAEPRQDCDATAQGWLRALQVRDPQEAAHAPRVAGLAVRLAGRMGVAADELGHVRRGALLHDVGKLGLPDAVLQKPGPLTQEEWAVMRLHPDLAADMLGATECLRPALAIPLCHHERWDGTGYPGGLAGEQIPLAARAFAAVDVWDALTNDRPYRRAWPVKRVREHLRSLAGSHLDAAVVSALLAEVA